MSHDRIRGHLKTIGALGGTLAVFSTTQLDTSHWWAIGITAGTAILVAALGALLDSRPPTPRR